MVIFHREKSKKCTEQAAALVFLKYNNLKDPRMMTPADAFRDDDNVPQLKGSATAVQDSSIMSCSKHVVENCDHKGNSKTSEGPDLEGGLCDKSSNNVNLTFDQSQKRSEFPTMNPTKDTLGLDSHGHSGQNGHGSDDLCINKQISLDDKDKQHQNSLAETPR